MSSSKKFAAPIKHSASNSRNKNVARMPVAYSKGKKQSSAMVGRCSNGACAMKQVGMMVCMGGVCGPMPPPVLMAPMCPGGACGMMPMMIGMGPACPNGLCSPADGMCVNGTCMIDTACPNGMCGNIYP